ncbi:hypothetical protein COL940_005439 [Colletotrichum noveboracense]|nr:hypothetical protein COL940_005439 [Colletotrichum noveboracense]
MEFVPTQDLVVARYATEVTRIEDFAEQDVRGWLTINRSARDGRRTPWALRILPDYIDKINSNFPRALIAIENSRNVGCINGIAMLETRDKITTVGGIDRPRKLYRAIHSGQPGDGIKSRLGCGSDAGPGWEHNVNRMWNPRELARTLSPSDDKDYLDNEVLIEHSIPKDSIVETYRWQEHKAQLDPGGGIEADARAVQSIRDKIKMDRQEKARKLREDNNKKAAEETGTRGEAEAQDDPGPRHDAEESDKKRKANDDDDEGGEPSPVAARRKRFTIGQKMTANSSL